MKAYANKTVTDVEKLVEKFNQLIDERIFACEDMPSEYLEEWRIVRDTRIDMLNWAKQTLKRFAKEVLGA